MRIITFLVTAVATIWMSPAMADIPERFLNKAAGQFSNMYQLAAGSGASSAPAIRMDVSRIRASETDWLEVIHRDIRSESVILRHQLFKILRTGTGTEFATAVYYVPVRSADDAEQPLYAESDLSLEEWAERVGAYYLEGCDIQWSYQNENFYGVRDSETCYFHDPSGERISLTSALELSEQGWSIQDTAITLESEFLPASVTGETIEFRDITFFTAEIEFAPSGLDEPVDVSLRQQLHDHGEQVQLYSESMALPFKVSVLRESGDTLRVQVFNRNSAEATESQTVERENGIWRTRLGELRITLNAKEAPTAN